MITRMEKVTVYVSSQEAARAFWTEKVGFVVTIEMPMGPNGTWLEVSPKGDKLTSLVLYSKEAMLQYKPEMVQHPGIIFATDDAEATWAKLKENGVKVTEIEKLPHGNMFNFYDNDENVYMVRG